MRRFLLCLALLLTLSAPAYASESACNFALAESLKNTVISIERVLDKSEMTGTSRGALGTAWFLDERHLVSIGHMATRGKLTRNWKVITLRWSDALGTAWKHSMRTEARIIEVVQTGMVEPLVIIEIKDPVPWAHITKIRTRPLTNNERVIGVAYEGYEKENTVVLVYGAGVVIAAHSMSWQIPLQMVDRNGHFRTFDEGTSGSPLFDCNGEVVAVMQAKKSGWGQTNNFAVSTSSLRFYSAIKD